MERETTKGDDLFGDNEEAIKNLADIPTPNIVAYKTIFGGESGGVRAQVQPDGHCFVNIRELEIVR